MTEKKGDSMKSFWKALIILIKKPSITIFMGIIALALIVVDYYSPTSVLGRTLFNPSKFSGGNVFEVIVNLLRLVLNYLLTPKGIMYTIGILLALAIIMGFFLSGYLRVINNALVGKNKVKWELAGGIKRYFFSMTIISFVTLVLGVFLIFFALVASVPAMVLTTAMVTGSSEYIVAALLVDFITALVLFFMFMFFSIYISFWYATVINGKKRAFREGKRIADRNFWGLVLRLLFLFLIFVIAQAIFSNMGSALFVLILKWLFNTMFFGFLVLYIMALYKQFEEKHI